LTNLSDGVTVQEPSGRVIYANDAAARSLGLAKASAIVDADLSELVARFRVLDDVGDPVPPDALPGRRVLAGETPPPSLLQIEDLQSGRRTWILLAANPISDADGKPILAVNVWHDVTEERRASEIAQFFAEAGRVLGGGLDDERTLQRVAELA